jgi:hypothetical protein
MAASDVDHVPRRFAALVLIEQALKGVRPNEQKIALELALGRVADRIAAADAKYRDNLTWGID